MFSLAKNLRRRKTELKPKQGTADKLQPAEDELEVLEHPKDGTLPTPKSIQVEVEPRKSAPPLIAKPAPASIDATSINIIQHTSSTQHAGSLQHAVDGCKLAYTTANRDFEARALDAIWREGKSHDLFSAVFLQQITAQ
jgi:hypothetical protein